MLATIDRQGRSGDEARIVGAEEGDPACDLLSVAKPADRHARHDLGKHVLRHRGHHFRFDITRRESIDGPAEFPPFPIGTTSCMENVWPSGYKPGFDDNLT